MRRLSLVILSVVAGFVAVVVTTLVVKSGSMRLESVDPVTSKADFRIREVRLEEDGGPIRWRLVADQAEVFEAEGRTGLRRPVVDIEDGTRVWKVRGDEGDVHQRTKDFELRRNVVVVSNDGVRLETALLRWDSRAKRLWTNAPVTISRQGTLIQGTGLAIYVAEDRASVSGPVRVAIQLARAAKDAR